MTFWENPPGVRLFKSVFSQKDICSFEDEVNKLEAETDRQDYLWKYHESDLNRLNRIEYFVKFSSVFMQLAKDTRLTDIASSLLGGPVSLMKDKINFKYPLSEGFAPHQDMSAGWGKYASQHITLAIPLCTTTMDNGCIMFADKQHDLIGNLFEDLNKDDFDFHGMNTDVGDVIAFDSLIPHMSETNNSSLRRVVLFFTYIHSHNGDQYTNYHNDKFKAVHPDISKIPGKSYRSGNTNTKKLFNGT